jgi:hypothetical protein
VQNSPARLPDVGLGPRVGLPGRRQPAGYGTSWSVLVSSTSGRSGPSQPNLFHHFPSTNLRSGLARSRFGRPQAVLKSKCIPRNV